MSRSFAGVVAIWVAAGLGVPAADAQEGLEIIQRSVELHGGEVYEHSLVELRLCSASGCYDISVTTDGGLYRHRVAGPISTGRREVVATNDSLRHWHNGAEVEVASGEEGQRLRDWATARIYFAFLPYRLNDPSVVQRDLGLERWGDRELRRVKITFRPGSSTDDQDQFVYWFDPQTARLEQFAYSFEGNPGGLRFRRLDNYRRIGGLLFFDQENLGAQGDGLSVDQIDPEFVERRMRLVSEIRLENIEVSALP